MKTDAAATPALTQPAHSPLPWRRHDMETDAIVSATDRKAIALVMSRARSDKESAANLELIVRCVNQHEALVSALDFVRKWDEMHPEENRLPSQLRSAVNTALANAKGR